MLPAAPVSMTKNSRDKNEQHKKNSRADKNCELEKSAMRKAGMALAERLNALYPSWMPTAVRDRGRLPFCVYTGQSVSDELRNGTGNVYYTLNNTPLSGKAFTLLFVHAKPTQSGNALAIQTSSTDAAERQFFIFISCRPAPADNPAAYRLVRHGTARTDRIGQYGKRSV
ncbi:hypothetical protein [Spirosoma sordidisoli]|uniref:hypothetical protein n=1 Tax=Spirosoma sordidisoli TaxID=2502893 RepID=UPI0013E9E532|nr:hypothetical protein [Spirosoma sordidisoli]